MFLRIRWFLLGAAGSVSLLAYLATQVKRARERMSARALARSGGRTVASLLDKAAMRISPDDPPLR